MSPATPALTPPTSFKFSFARFRALIYLLGIFTALVCAVRVPDVPVTSGFTLAGLFLLAFGSVGPVLYGAENGSSIFKSWVAMFHGLAKGIEKTLYLIPVILEGSAYLVTAYVMGLFDPITDFVGWLF